MRTLKTLVAGVVAAMVLCTGAFAGSDLNEVGAFLVYPLVVAVPFGGPDEHVMMGGMETLITITNAGPDDLTAHISYIDGQMFEQNGFDNTEPGDYYNSTYCYECDFEIPLTGNDTETLTVNYEPGGTRIKAEDLYLDMSCPWLYGMLVVAIEDEDGNTISDNVLLGEEVIINYRDGSAISIPAIPFQGSGNDGNQEYAFDDSEYAKMPRVVAADFLAPNLEEHYWNWAALALFTLGFERQFPPLVDCSVIGFDAHENPFSASFQFGCWTFFDIYDISPEFYWPNLGVLRDDPRYGGHGHHGPSGDTHGWLQLNCRVDTNPAAADGFEANGGVHGAIVQWQDEGTWLPASPHAPDFGSAAAWGRLLYQSVTTGDAVTLVLEQDALGMD